MSLTRFLNISDQELIERMGQFVDVNSALPLVFKAVLTKNNDSWSLFMGELTLFEDNIGESHRACCYRYPNFQFICSDLVDLTLAEVLEGLNNDACLPIPNLPTLSPVESNINWTESLIPSHASKGTFPVRSFSGRVCDKAYCDDTKLIAHGMPFRLSAFEYVKEFLGLERFHGSSDGRKGELSIKIPDRRGRLVLADRKIQFEHSHNNVLSVVGAIDGAPVLLASPNDSCEHAFEEAIDTELWLVTKNDEVIDYRSSTEWQYRYETKADNTNHDKLLELIADGESEHCEFKAYIDLTAKKNDKAWEIDKTVCAFSNHQGGKLFIGVDDDTQVVGIDEGCRRHYGCEPREAADLYLKAVTKRLQESLTKNQCFKAYLVSLYDQLVVVVDVNKANGLNELNQKKVAYIRRGASSRLMTPTEIQTFLSRKDAFELEQL